MKRETYMVSIYAWQPLWKTLLKVKLLVGYILKSHDQLKGAVWE